MNFYYIDVLKFKFFINEIKYKKKQNINNLLDKYSLNPELKNYVKQYNYLDENSILDLYIKNKFIDFKKNNKKSLSLLKDFIDSAKSKYYLSQFFLNRYIDSGMDKIFIDILVTFNLFDNNFLPRFYKWKYKNVSLDDNLKWHIFNYIHMRNMYINSNILLNKSLYNNFYYYINKNYYNYEYIEYFDEIAKYNNLDHNENYNKNNIKKFINNYNNYINSSINKMIYFSNELRRKINHRKVSKKYIYNNFMSIIKDIDENITIDILIKFLMDNNIVKPKNDDYYILNKNFILKDINYEYGYYLYKKIIDLCP